ncbi:Alcohol dehydrogenase 2 [Hypsizygus marmoreus]|uniref:Alcohol dehydrogenase 2 n=1 Tax=Hypsizygus marmoreus TaxID=39966 RepID=A0A369JW11_HYPMA|nr:Alcohol dehydrogenase 2 [Hypsizygus marmoreus]
MSGFYSWTDTLKGVYYGPGSTTTALPKLLNTLGIKKALVVTGTSLYNKTDIVKKVEDILRGHDAYGATFYEIGQHSPIAGIRRGMETFKVHQCDGIVTVGGGSPIDAAKAILYNLQLETGGPTLSQIAIPTTLSAAEYSIGAGYTDDLGNKVAVSSHALAPAGIILDAELTLATPERLWLSTGIRALDHAVETLYRPLVPIPVKVLSYAALADLFTYLPQSKANPQDVDIRQKLQVASWMSLWPLKLEKYSALGLSHALGHKLGATYGIPHGITSCLTLGPTVALKADIASQEDKELLAKSLFYLRQPSTGSIDGDVLKLSSLIKTLVADLGLQSNLEEYKVPPEDLPKVASRALGSEDDPNHARVVRMLQGIYSSK